MGDIIETFPVRSGRRGRSSPLRLYFDTGSPYTFVKDSVARRLGKTLRLADGRPFGGLGDGRFVATHLVELEIQFLDIGCPHVAYVVPDEALEARYDVLIGHDLMQRLDIRPLPKKRRVLLDRGALQMALTVR